MGARFIIVALAIKQPFQKVEHQFQWEFKATYYQFRPQLESMLLHALFSSILKPLCQLLSL